MLKEVCLLSITDVFKDFYSIPLYQRCFSWSREQIEALLQDIYSCYLENKEVPYYVGCLVVMKRDADEGPLYEVIDGQQRLTFFTLLTKILGIKTSGCKIRYESRRLEQEFLEKFCEKEDFYKKNDFTENFGALTRRNADLIKAIDDIYNANIAEDGSVCRKTIADVLATDTDEKKNFIEYIQDKVLLLRTEVSKNTDVNSYFEIVNNRGKQLQEHEILKSLIMSGLGDDVSRQMKFGMIWDACSQMNLPIQKCFPKTGREFFFDTKGNAFIRFDRFKSFFEQDNGTSNTIEPKSFAELLNAPSDPFANEVQGDEEREDAQKFSEYQSIIDFPNFLMHVFKLFYDKNNQIALDKKFLMRDYKRVVLAQNKELEPVEFVYNLFLTRTLFDRFIIKIEGAVEDNGEDDDVARAKEDENFSWRLLEPVVDKKGALDYRTDTEFSDDRFVKSLSMLQVTFKNRHHKKWLQYLLKFLVDSYRKKNAIPVDENFKKEYLKMIHYYIGEYFTRNITKEHLAGMGTKTPHFLFNLIDYLYWVANKKHEQFPELKYVKDFNFRYYNSVEHHLAQNPETKQTEEFKDAANLIDNLGNLCLISKGTNSRLQNVSPLEKVENRKEKAPEVNGVKAFPPKRQIMYLITEDARKWGCEQIQKHYNNICALLEKTKALLGLEQTVIGQVQKNSIQENDASFRSHTSNNAETIPMHRGEIQMTDLERFKKLLEYFVAHVEYCQKRYLKREDDVNAEPSTCVGYAAYVQPYIAEDGGEPDPLEMDEWRPNTRNAQRNREIKGQWETFGDKTIRMVVKNHFGKYCSSKCFLDWGGWRNINNEWNDDRSKIIALKIRKNLSESQERPDWNEIAKVTLIQLGLFDESTPNESLKNFFDTYLNL